MWAGGGSPEVEGLEGGEGGERRGQRRAAFGADVVCTATKRGRGGEGGVAVSEKRRGRGRGHYSGGECACVCVGDLTSAGMCTLRRQAKTQRRQATAMAGLGKGGGYRRAGPHGTVVTAPRWPVLLYACAASPARRPVALHSAGSLAYCAQSFLLYILCTHTHTYTHTHTHTHAHTHHHRHHQFNTDTDTDTHTDICPCSFLRPESGQPNRSNRRCRLTSTDHGYR